MVILESFPPRVQEHGRLHGIKIKCFGDMKPASVKRHFRTSEADHHRVELEDFIQAEGGENRRQTLYL